MELDEKDRSIVEEIMKNPKIKDKELAEKIDLSRSGTAKRRKKLEENNEIQYYASPQLQKISSKAATGLFRLPTKKRRREAKDIAKKFSEREEIKSCWVRKASSNRWGVSFIAISSKLRGKEETTDMIEEWTQEIRKEADGEVGIDIGHATYFIKMLGKNVQEKEEKP